MPPIDGQGLSQECVDELFIGRRHRRAGGSDPAHGVGQPDAKAGTEDGVRLVRGGLQAAEGDGSCGGRERACGRRRDGRQAVEPEPSLLRKLDGTLLLVDRERHRERAPLVVRERPRCGIGERRQPLERKPPPLGRERRGRRVGNRLQAVERERATTVAGERGRDVVVKIAEAVEFEVAVACRKQPCRRGGKRRQGGKSPIPGAALGECGRSFFRQSLKPWQAAGPLGPRGEDFDGFIRNLRQAVEVDPGTSGLVTGPRREFSRHFRRDLAEAVEPDVSVVLGQLARHGRGERLEPVEPKLSLVRHEDADDVFGEFLQAVEVDRPLARFHQQRRRLRVQRSHRGKHPVYFPRQGGDGRRGAVPQGWQGQAARAFSQRHGHFVRNRLQLEKVAVPYGRGNARQNRRHLRRQCRQAADHDPGPLAGRQSLGRLRRKRREPTQRQSPWAFPHPIRTAGREAVLGE